MEYKLSRYVDIAIDIAVKIKKRELKEGTKLKGRSLAAAQYNVSAETIRKAFILLADKGIVEVKEKSGVFVISREQAIDFLDTYNKHNKVIGELDYINELLKKKKEIDSKISKSMRVIQNSMNDKNQDFPIEYFSIQIHKEYFCCDKTIKENDFFGHSGATLFGIVNKDKVISYLNPNYIIKEDDILYFSGEKSNLDKVFHFIKNNI
jgi:K+/H+ antiporter YhaU regulatory subunit KhtT